MNYLTRWLALIALTSLGLLARSQSDNDADPLASAIAAAQQRVVKLYGATLGREKAYGSGVIVSPDGKIVTALSVLLEGRNLRVVLSDGRALPAQVLARDERRQVALLKIDAADMPFFELTESRELQPGDWVIAAGNPFKVADGPEPVSVSVGVFSGRANLAARHRARDFPYDGPVLLTDIIVTAPGSAGGALVAADGRLVGLIGKAVVSKYTNTWLNCALPVEEIAAFVSGQSMSQPDTAAPVARDATPPPELGIQLFDVGGRVRPAYVERVRPDSPAWKAGVRPNDLVVSLDGQPVATCADFDRLLAKLRAGRPVALVVKRGDELAVLTIAFEEGAR